MSKNFSKLLVMSLATCATAFSATGRGVDTNLSNVKFKEFNSSAYSLTGGKMGLMTENKDREDSFGGCLSVTGFWEQSINGERGSKKLAQGYGVDGLNSFDVIQSADNVGTDTVLTTGQVDSRRLVHNYNNTTGSSWASATMALEAKHRRFGANIEYSQCLSNFYEGLKFRVSTAVLGVRNELVTAYTTEVPDGTTAVTIKQFFEGSNVATTGADGQIPLSKGKFKDGSQTHYALNDINACLGLEVVSTDSAGVCLGISGVIPTGRELTGEYVMEPQVGNRHFRLGLEGAVHACLAEGADYKVGFASCAQWHYAFARQAVRLPSHTGQNYGQYWLGYKTGATQASSLEPLMNLLVPGGNNVDVKPEHQFNMTSLLSVEKSCFCAEVGYNLTFAQEEKNTSLLTISDYNVVLANHENAAGAKAGTALVASNVNLNHPSQLNHNLFGSVGFSGKDWQYPVSLNLVGGYELAGDRKNNREIWHVSLKGSFCF